MSGEAKVGWLVVPAPGQSDLEQAQPDVTNLATPEVTVNSPEMGHSIQANAVVVQVCQHGQ